MAKYESYHGTNKKACEEFYKKGIKIVIRSVHNESSKTHKNKVPGSFGYGFYTFLDDSSLAKDFSLKFNNENEVSVLKIVSEIEDEELLSLLDVGDREKFHAFYDLANTSASIILDKFGRKKDTKYQHVLDGIVIELFLKKLESVERINVKAVLGQSFTPRTKNSFFSYIPNGSELCIRDHKVIKSIEEYEKE